jgi:hypothetical protein
MRLTGWRMTEGYDCGQADACENKSNDNFGFHNSGHYRLTVERDAPESKGKEALN